MRNELENWHKISKDEIGLHDVIIPTRDETKILGVSRLNLEAMDEYELYYEYEEINVLVVAGKAEVILNNETHSIEKYDSFYAPSQTKINVKAKSSLVLYIGKAPCEKYGKAFVRKLDFHLPIGDIHQIHGEGSGQREVMFTLAPQDEASRLICGITWGGDGAWTSWPPHQHEKDLEEVYCYFDIAKHGMHFSYKTDTKFSDAVCHIVGNGSMVEAAGGYHPTVAVPGSKNIYFWILGARRHESRRYDLAVLDPDIAQGEL